MQSICCSQSGRPQVKLNPSAGVEPKCNMLTSMQIWLWCWLILLVHAYSPWKVVAHFLLWSRIARTRSANHLFKSYSLVPPPGSGWFCTDWRHCFPIIIQNNDWSFLFGLKNAINSPVSGEAQLQLWSRVRSIQYAISNLNTPQLFFPMIADENAPAALSAVAVVINVNKYWPTLV